MRTQVDTRIPSSRTHEILETVPTAAMLLTESRRILFANLPAREILEHGDGLRAERGRLRAAAPNQNAELAKLITRASSSEARCLRLERGSHRRPYELWARRVAADSDDEIVVFATDPERERAPGIEQLRSVYSLTLAEARLTQLLGQGRDLFEAATQLGVTRNTVRKRLCHVFEKVGVRSQAQLVARVLAG